MSNYLAIATVSAALSQTLQSAVGADVPGAAVRLAKPEGAANGTQPPEVRIYLYHVSHNAAYCNTDLPARRSDGQLVQRPRIALDLHYLISFVGDEGQLEPQRLLGSVARTIHARPVLTREAVRATISNPAFSYLAPSNLADEVELVKFSPLPLSLEELSKLWSVFFQIPYALSLAYRGTVVLIESEETPQPALPVRERNVYAMPFKFPAIESVTAQGGEGAPIVSGGTLVISGTQLRGDVTRVLSGGIERTPATVGDTAITLPVPPDLRAGVQGLQVIHPIMIGTPETEHRGVQSNVAPFVLRPQITSVSASGAQVTLQVEPIIGASQRVMILLNERNTTAPAAYTFQAPVRSADTSSLDVSIAGIRTGTEYFVRVQIDGAESALDLDPASPTFGPTVEVS